MTKEDVVKKIAFNETEPTMQRDKIAEPEKALIAIIEQCKIHMDEISRRSIFFVKEGRVFFKIENNVLWCDADCVWTVIQKSFPEELPYKKMQKFISKVIKKRYNVRGLTPCLASMSREPVIKGARADRRHSYRVVSLIEVADQAIKDASDLYDAVYHELGPDLIGMCMRQLKDSMRQYEQLRSKKADA